MLVDTFAPKQRGMAFAAYGIVVIVGPVLGPVIGGVITDNASWHWCFLINVPVGILSLFLVNAFVDEPKAGRAQGSDRGSREAPQERATMLAQRSQVHQAQLVETLNPLNPNYTNAIGRATQVLSAQSPSQIDSMRQGTAVLYRSLGQQAQMLSYVDVFHVLMLVVFAAIPLLFLMQGTKGGQGGGAA